jgi:hypothetical protein
MAKTIEIRPFADGNVVNNWWQWALVGVIAASGLIGIITALFWIIQTILGRTRVCEHNSLDVHVIMESLYHIEEKGKNRSPEANSNSARSTFPPDIPSGKHDREILAKANFLWSILGSIQIPIKTT